MKWLLLATSNSHIYTIGRYNNQYLIGKFGEESAPDSVKKLANISQILYNHRYSRTENIRTLNYILEMASNISMVRTLKHFTCISCDNLSFLHTAVPCLHVMCSKCVADKQYIGESCPQCLVPLKLLHKTLNTIPISHIARIVKQLDDKLTSVLPIDIDML